ncbi:peptidoglycan DD-metalloendopeptidase family protein [Gilvimarinus agarilyticus]|uniref:murein hydrolase activator EnvC family protein n=1 Tax=unclassified Gilvimarinus TaxID=2642066 RepID=UPI001C097356|nr:MULTISPECIES: peptidoglycan DD-metalloendopeptidase family protein [unclassified Gilvimarinus]MBU2885801.1 peptidoglycan DD-metalloendopeptidase family protein [Gilvimarinus agarilyticus]MDO6570655.1 peptidoglycan DD-metalloendopeptidase family protein [Gilvimarinus sp. 2_MG-2023]MDO6746680.1 peptidoglycan DD-metalloendopeptidase family protein [Gilvimarinus sp. 1_MG-2023]
MRFGHFARSPRPLVAALLCLFLGSASLCALGADDAAEYQRKLEALQKNIEQLKKDLNQVKSERGKLQHELEESETEIDSLENKVDQLNDKIQTQDTELQTLQQRQRNLNRQRQGQKQQIAAQVRSAYQGGPQSPLKILLNQQSPERLSRLNTYHDYLLKARNDKLDQYLSTINELKTLTPKVQASRDALATQKQQLSLRQRQLQSQQKKRASTLQQLASIIANKDAKLAADQENQAHLAVLLEEMTTTLGTSHSPFSGQAFSGLQGQLPWPTQGSVRHNYGSDRVGNQLSWNGLVIEAKTGAPVVAIHGGMVIFADYLRGHGLLMIVDHGEGYMSLYAHNQTLLKRPGERVQGGETIARVGNSGGQNYSGLYFEIRHQGRPTNPKPWLARA